MDSHLGCGGIGSCVALKGPCCVLTKESGRELLVVAGLVLAHKVSGSPAPGRMGFCITEEDGNVYYLMSVARTEMLPKKGLKMGAGGHESACKSLVRGRDLVGMGGQKSRRRNE